MSGPLNPEVIALKLGEAGPEVRASEILPDVWSLFTIHGGGNSKRAPKIPNRAFIYRLHAADGSSFLAMVNAVWPDEERGEPFAMLKRMEDELGAKLRFIINPGPEHHLSLVPYAKAFPEARVVVSAGRIERENPALCALDNVETIPKGDALPELAAAGLHVHVWDGWMDGRLLARAQFRFRCPLGTTEPTLFFHAPTRSLINGGHGWFLWGKGDALPLPVRLLLRAREGEVVWSPRHHVVFDEERCQASAARLLEWPVETLLDLHVGKDRHLVGTAGKVVRSLVQPVVDGEWSHLPFKRGRLEIPEGYVTGGDWKSYRDIPASAWSDELKPEG
jgi:hypothetical protein